MVSTGKREVINNNINFMYWHAAWMSCKNEQHDSLVLLYNESLHFDWDGTLLHNEGRFCSNEM